MSSPATLIALLIVANVVAWATVSWVLRRRRALTRSRPYEWMKPGSQAGSFAPLSAVSPLPVPVPVPVPAVALADEPAHHVVYLRPVSGAATIYEIVWYREDDRLVFALQPLDGRTALIGPQRSGTFAWVEERDPPASLRAAQREHAKLRERLQRDGWSRAGRGERWFSHRFKPPET
jgi:hypothetical protein